MVTFVLSIANCNVCFQADGMPFMVDGHEGGQSDALTPDEAQPFSWTIYKAY